MTHHIYIYRLILFIYIIERWKVSFCSVSLFPLDSPKTSFATDVIQWAISFYIELASSPNFHSVSLIILSLNITCLSLFKFHHLILGSLAPSLPSLNTKIEYSKSMLGCYTLSRYTLQSLKYFWSARRVRKKSIWLTLEPLLKVLKCESLFRVGKYQIIRHSKNILFRVISRKRTKNYRIIVYVTFWVWPFRIPFPPFRMR